MNLKKALILIITVIGIFSINPFNVFGDETGDYLIKINRVQNCVTIYQKDGNGEYTIPYKSMVCSTGLNIESTPLGTYSISEKQDWEKLADGSYAQYCSRVVDSIMIHSVPYRNHVKNSLKTEEYNKLGQPASMGCIRMRAMDAQWIFDNCPEGTEVVIYDDNVSPGPLGKPENVLIPEEHEYAGWDPTDGDEMNPWRNLCPTINGVQDIEMQAGESRDPLDNISATDICGNDISQYIKIDGEYDIWKPGTYQLAYMVTDGFGYSARSEFTLKVNENPDETTEADTTLETTRAIQQEEEISKTGVGPVMTILFLAVVTFFVSSGLVKYLKNR